MQKVSFICTVYNEEKTIANLLDSLFAQSILPHEIIIVDGGSTDNTIEQISLYKIPSSKRKYPIKLIIKKGNRAVGRNTAIKAAKNDIIACSDGGCILDKNWLKNITAPFKDKTVDVVSGYYASKNNNIFEKCLETYVSVMPDNIDKDNFLPSSRSVAFRKNAWKKVSGYPEYLDTCEDLLFDKKLKQSGARFYFAQNALVYWRQRKNIFEAAKQFFLYAEGDGRAHNFRIKVPFIFLRYIFFFSILSIADLLKINKLYYLDIILLFIYLLWSIIKNYKYIKHPLAFIYLPTLQITADLSVMAGTIVGYIHSIKKKTICKFFKTNWMIIAVILFYTIVVLTGINWGIPNSNHPFDYHMDEWAQAQSIRALFRHGTPNGGGSSSHGAVFQFFLSGIYLIPFMVLHLVNPFIIKSSLLNIDMQHRLFVILRLNTLLFGILTIITIAAIAKKFLKTPPLIPILLTTITPIFLILSGYFKYDLALMFWLSLSILFAFRYERRPTLTNFIFFAFISALAFATKVSAIPLFISFIIAFFLFTPKFKTRYHWLFLGITMFIITFLIAGIPDFFIAKNEYLSWLNSNLGSPVGYISSNIMLPMPYWIFYPIVQYSVVFGKTFYVLFVFSFFVWVYIFIKSFLQHSFSEYKHEFFLFSSLFLFILSLIPLQIGAGGNRLMVLLPFLALLSGALIAKILVNFNGKVKSIVILIFIICTVFQTAECLAFVSTRLGPDPYDTSSEWLVKNIPEKTIIGIEPVPIFQLVPNIILKEYYKKIYNIPNHNKFIYKEIDSNTKKLPSIIVVGDADVTKKYLKFSSRKSLLNKLRVLGYKKVAEFTPNLTYFDYFNFQDSFYFSPLVAFPESITIYTK